MKVTVRRVDSKEDGIAIACSAVREQMADIPRNARIIIKPNICINKAPDTGATTHHEILIGVLEALRDHTDVSIVESHATSSDFEKNVEGWGSEFLRNYPSVSLVNLSALPLNSCLTIQGLHSTFNLPVPDLLVSYDYLINIPVMKVHLHTGMSVALKNLFGLLPVKNKSHFHLDIHDMVFGLYKFFKPSLTIVDGIEGMEGMGPLFGEPARAKVMLYGCDAVAIDVVCARIMGINPLDIRYLRECIHLTRGTYDLSDISIDGELPERSFSRSPTLLFQVVRSLFKHEAITIETIKNSIDVPRQTKDNLPILMDVLHSRGIVSRTGDEISLNRRRLDKLIQLFPEVMDLLLYPEQEEKPMEVALTGK